MVFPTWATVSSQYSFCWLYRASPSLAAKNIINLISVLAFWWCPCVESSLLLKGGCLLWLVFSWQNSVGLCPASFCSISPNFPVFQGISWLSTLAFQFPMMRRTLFLVLVLEGLVHFHRSSQRLLQHQWLGHRLGLLWCWMVCPGNEPSSFCPCDSSYNVTPMISSLVSRKQAVGEQWFCLLVCEVEVFPFSGSCPRLHMPPVGWWGHL